MKHFLVGLACWIGVACAHSGTYGAAAFRVESNVPDASVLIDDVLVGRASEWAGEGKHLRPGFHRVEIRYPGYYSYYAEVDLAEGGSAVVKATLRPFLE